MPSLIRIEERVESREDSDDSGEPIECMLQSRAGEQEQKVADYNDGHADDEVHEKDRLGAQFVLVCVHHRPIELAPCAAQQEEPLVARLIRKTVQLHELANQSNSAIDIVQVHVMKVTPIEDSTNVYG